MATTAAILDVLLRADTDQATRGLRQFDSSLDRTRRTASTAVRDNDRLNRSSSRVGSALKTAAGAAAGAAAAYVSISQAKTAVDRTQDLFNATMNLKKGFGLSAKAASGFNAAVLSRGGEVSATAGAFRTLAKNVEEAGKGSETATKAFRAFGISAKDLQTLSKDQLLFEISDGMLELTDKTRETTAATTLFGRTAAKEVIPVLRGGSKAFKEQIALAEEAGATFSDKGGIENMKQLGAAQRELEIRTLGLQVQFTKHLVPALIDMIKWIAQAGKDVRKFFETPFGKLLLEAIALTAKRIAWLAKVSFKAFMAMVGATKWLVRAFVNVKNAVADAAEWVVDKWRDAMDFIRSIPAKIRSGLSGIGNIVKDAFAGALDFVIDFVNDVIDVINMIPGVSDIGHVGGGSGGTAQGHKGSGGRGRGRKGTTKRKMGGMVVPGAGSGDKVPLQAMVEPGEGIFVMNRNAMGALAAANSAVPRFQGGGAMEVASKTPAGKVIGAVAGGAGALIDKLPSPGDLPDWLLGTGEYVIEKAVKFLKDKVGIPGFGGANPGALSQAGIIAVGRMLQAAGYQVGEHPAFGGVDPNAHTGNSAHYRAAAIDVNHGGNEMAALDRAAKILMKINHSQIIWRNRDLDTGAPIGGHMDHLHFAMQRGGVIREPKLGNKWITKTAGSSWDADEAFTLLRQVGASREVAKKLSAKVAGESSGIPGNVGHDPGGTTGYGLWQITTGYNDDIIRKYGGPKGVMRPVANAMAALDVYARGGIGQWYAPSGRPGSLLWDRINRAAPKSKPKDKKKKKKKTGSAAAAADPVEAVENPLLELLAAQDLLNLQRWQIAAWQHPLLGLDVPGRPTPLPRPGAAPLDTFWPAGATLTASGSAKALVKAGKKKAIAGIGPKKGRNWRAGIKGYQGGGVVPGPIGSPQLAMVHGGETIAPAGASVTINIANGMEWLRPFIRAEVNGTTRGQARHAGRGLPGRGGGRA